MELTIFKNIIYGELKPWSSTAVDEKFYRQNLTKDFIKPTKTINSYYKALKELHNNKPNLFKEDGLEVYIAQKDTDRKTEILYIRFWFMLIYWPRAINGTLKPQK